MICSATEFIRDLGNEEAARKPISSNTVSGSVSPMGEVSHFVLGTANGACLACPCLRKTTIATGDRSDFASCGVSRRLSASCLVLLNAFYESAGRTHNL